jgi:ABC-2 type transport system permease protein
MSIAELRFDVTPLPSVMWKQTRAQLLSSLRIPAFSLTTILLPIMFFAFFGLPYVHQTIGNTNITVGPYVMASFGAYAVSSAMVFNFGIGVAMARGQKMDLLQRATPLPSGVAIAATVVNAMVFALISLIALFAFASIAGGVSLSVGTWLTLTFRLLVGAVPLIGLGMAIGYAAGPNSAPAVTNLIYLPMSFASGLFIPVAQLPAVIQKAAPYLPTYHYGQIAWNAVGAPTESMESAVIWLGAWTVLFFALALRFIRLDQSRKFS